MAVREGVAARGILICGSGTGASVAANKIEGIRAGLAQFTQEERHLRRLAKVAKLEETRGI